jgi:hypothetical protein
VQRLRPKQIYSQIALATRLPRRNRGQRTRTVRNIRDLSTRNCRSEEGRALRRNLGIVGVIILLASIPAGFAISYAVGEPEGFAWGFFLSLFLIVAALILVGSLSAPPYSHRQRCCAI